MLNYDLLKLVAVEGDESEVPVEESTEETVETEQPANEGGQPEVPEEIDNSIDIDGEKYSVDDIKSWKSGSMRQADYTRKTQEVSKLKEQYNDAIELYDYIKSNPEIAKQLSEIADNNPSIKNKASDLSNPYNDKIQELDIKLKTMEIDKQLEQIKSKDKDVDELQVLDIALKNSLSVELAYNIWRGQNFDKIVSKKLSETKKTISKEIQDNNGITKTLITEGDKVAAKANSGLNKDEMSAAEKLDMSYEEYAKWKNYKR